MARGVYTPTRRTDPSNPRSATFQLKEGIALYGGFAGTETLRTQRNWTTNVTVLSGDLDNNDLKDTNGVVTTTAHIVGNNAYKVVYAANITSTTILDGFTITAGHGDRPVDGAGIGALRANMVIRHTIFRGNLGRSGGAMQNEQSHLTLTDVTFGHNQATMSGGGMLNSDSHITLTHVTFDQNRSVMGGGGIWSLDSYLTLTDVAFNGNQADWGGGMCIFNSHATLTDVTFHQNQATWGGGMFSFKSYPVLTQVTFNQNQATWGGRMFSDESYPVLTDVTFNQNRAKRGGGMLNNESHPMLTNVALSGNRADQDGGGMYAGRSVLTATNVLLNGNLAPQGGGAAFNDYSVARLVNVTFGGNYATGEGGAIRVVTQSHVTLINTILWGNAAPTGAQVYLAASSMVTITYSDVQGGWAGTGNLNADPLFVAPVAATHAPTITGKYRLQAGSPAVDKGNNAAVPAGVATDLDGNPRIVGTAVDMGAYERQRSAVYLPVVRR